MDSYLGELYLGYENGLSKDTESDWRNNSGDAKIL
jgi:hypothetical protein